MLSPSQCLLCLLLVSLLAACGGEPLGDGHSSSSAASMPSMGSSAVNDTGRISCSSDSQADVPCDSVQPSQQDGDFGRDALARDGELSKVGGGLAGFDFSKLGADGEPLPIQSAAWREDGTQAQGSMWYCVKDNHTGLIWEVKQRAAERLRSGRHTYTWYNAQADENGGMAGVEDGDGQCAQAPCNTEAFVAQVNQAQLCGYTDWRVPSVAELHSIAHLGRVDPAIDTHFFPNTLGLRHWTAEPVAEFQQLAWYVYFSDASVSFTNTFNDSYLRLVRGGD